MYIWTDVFVVQLTQIIQIIHTLGITRITIGTSEGGNV